MEAEELFKAGKLGDAVECQLAIVKKNPTDTNARFFLAELSAFQGDWDRADRQLDAIVQQSTGTPLLTLLFRQLVRAEIIREQVFNEGRAPELVVELDQESQLQLELNTALRLNQPDQYASLLERSKSLQSAVNGDCDGKAFSVVQDLDDRFRGVAEILTASGKYFWLPWQNVQSVDFAKPERPMDLVWRMATITVEGGPDGEVYMPVRYPNPKAWADEDQLGRGTQWQEHAEGIVTGTGQRMILIEDDGVPIMEMNRLSIESSES